MRDEGKKEGFDFIPQPSSLSPAFRTEFDFINRIRRRALQRKAAANASNSSLIPHPSSLSYGIGDDAAVIKQFAGRDTVITADLLVEEIDFRLTNTTPRLLGHKALAVSLSDIAAMGARPRWALLSIGLPHEIWHTNFVDELYAGFFALADDYHVILVGGDVSRTPERVVIDSIVVGETARDSAVLRSGARPGDHIFVTGSLGDAAAGLNLLERGVKLWNRRAYQRQFPFIERLLLRHLRPEPRVAWGALLGEEHLATAMIDISDGLSSDLAHLCRESGVGAFIEAARIPVSSQVVRLGRRVALNPLSLALHGGEDFELLFTVRPRDLARMPQRVGGVSVTYIGDVTDQAGRVLIAAGKHVSTLAARGFSHFV